MVLDQGAVRFRETFVVHTEVTFSREIIHMGTLLLMCQQHVFTAILLTNRPGDMKEPWWETAILSTWFILFINFVQRGWGSELDGDDNDTFSSGRSWKVQQLLYDAALHLCSYYAKINCLSMRVTVIPTIRVDRLGIIVWFLLQMAHVRECQISINLQISATAELHLEATVWTFSRSLSCDEGYNFQMNQESVHHL